MDMDKKKTGILIFCLALIITFSMGLAACSDNNPDKSNPVSAAKAGDIIEFGGFDWRVLEVKEGKALVLSDKTLFRREYHTEQNIPVTWEECDLRQYLNGQFYDYSFSKEEKKRIVETAVINKDNPWFNKSGQEDVEWAGGGNDTKDKVFLLSLDEVLLYFGDSGQVENQQVAQFHIDDQFNEKRITEPRSGIIYQTIWWWLRSPGIFSTSCETNFCCAASVSINGHINIYGDYMFNDIGGVRPALWLKM